MDPQINHDGRLTVPPELIRPILEHLVGHTYDLLTCSTVSKTFAAEAQRVLFRIVTNLDGGDQRTVSFLNTIINSPDRLALYVRVFKLHMTYTLQEPILTAIPVAFRMMHNLQHLYFRTYKATPFGHALRGVKFVLEGLDWGSRMDERELGLNFLPIQPQLKYIRLKDWNSNAWVGGGQELKDVCPHLESVDGPGVVLQAFLPGHEKAKVVTWNPSRAESLDPSTFVNAAFTESLNRVECLSYTLMFGRHLLWDTSPWLTSLLVLELQGYERSDLYHLISNFPTVQHLILSAASAQEAFVAWDTVDKSKAIEQTFVQWQSLQCLDIQSPRETDYVRWRRGSAEPLERISEQVARRNFLSYTGVFRP